MDEDRRKAPARGPAEVPGPGTPDPLSTVARLEEQLLGGPRTLTLADLAERFDADVAEIRQFWHSLGLPTTEEDAVAYTEADAAVVGLLLTTARENEVQPRTSVSMVRSIGHTTDRLVLWQVEALVEHLAGRYRLDDVSARLALLDRLGDIAPVLEAQLLHAWRRQMAAIAARFAAEFGTVRDVPGGADELPLARAVGFADMVAFTTRTAQLGSTELADFVQQFETRSRDVVTNGGGRVVKTIGDAVLFVADDELSGARVALGLAEAFGADTATPVRVGWVWGRVLSRFGDVFGPSVNLAARLTSEAAPGSVLLDQVTAARLADRPEYVLTELPQREVPGVGLLCPVQLRPATPGPAAGSGSDPEQGPDTGPADQSQRVSPR